MMSQQAINKLLTLAHDRSEHGRGNLVTELATLFERSDVILGVREQSLVNDIVDELISNAQITARQQLAEMLAPKTTTPRRLVLALASDRIEVARPILMHSPIFTDSDLMSLVATQGVEHSRAIALREEIGEALADALIVTGDLEVMQNVAENLGAKISPKTMTVLTNAARFAEKLCRPLLQRPEMTPESASKLYWWTSQDMRRFALQRFGVTVGQIDQTLEQTVDDLLARYENEKNNEQVMAYVADWLIERDLNTPKILVQVLRLGHFRLFNVLLARLIDLPVALTDVIVAEMGGRSLAAACRGTNMEKPQFVSIFLLSRAARRDEQVVHPRELNHALLAFDRLNPVVARQLLDTWRRDPSYLIDRAQGRPVAVQ
ncbi:MAG: DUF2336 domain-containing protein [Alphaproteobacteria bacterium]